MNKLMLFLITAGIVVLVVFAIVPLFNFAIFDFQCHKGGCSDCSASFFSCDLSTTADFKPESGCYKDCKVRNFRCSFDEEFEQNCLSCIKSCKEKFPTINQPRSQFEKFEECRKECYKV